MGLRENLLPILKQHTLYFKEKYQETEGIYTFIFVPAKPIKWIAGQHGIFKVNHVKITRPIRPFSVASIPEEGNVRISVKIGHQPSEFKQALLNLEPGMTISMRGPVGSLNLMTQKPRLFTAGGIGITPYRAMIKNMLLNPADFPEQTQLLYMDSSKEYIYTDELQEAIMLPSFDVNYHDKRQDFLDEIDQFVTKYQNQAEYYIVGPKKMVQSVEQLLKNKGIQRKNIKKDTFIGY